MLFVLMQCAYTHSIASSLLISCTSSLACAERSDHPNHSHSPIERGSRSEARAAGHACDNCALGTHHNLIRLEQTMFTCTVLGPDGQPLPSLCHNGQTIVVAQPDTTFRVQVTRSPLPSASLLVDTAVSAAWAPQCGRMQRDAPPDRRARCASGQVYMHIDGADVGLSKSIPQGGTSVFEGWLESMGTCCNLRFDAFCAATRLRPVRPAAVQAPPPFT